MEGENHYTRAEDACHRAEMAPTAWPGADADLAAIHATLAICDQLALIRAAIERATLAIQNQCPGPHLEFIPGEGLRTVEDVPLPDPSDGACRECGTPELLGHKLSCSHARG